MKVDADRFSVEIPDVFEDVTSYVFKERPVAPAKKGPLDTLSVSFEPMPERVPLSEIVAHFERGVGRAAGASASFRHGSTKAGNTDVAFVEVKLAGAAGASFFGVSRWPGGLVAKVVYETTREDGAQVFEHVASSARPIGVRRAADGYVRRRAGRMWIEMPVAHAGIRAYSFAARPGRVRLFAETESDGPEGIPDFDSWVSHGPLDSIEIEPLNEGSCPADRRPIKERSWRADVIGETADPLGSTWFRDARIALGGGAHARVWMLEEPTPDMGDLCFADVVASIRVPADRP